MNCHESTSFTRNFCRQYCPIAAEELKKVCSFKTRKPQTKPNKLRRQSQEYRTDSSDATDAELLKSVSQLSRVQAEGCGAEKNRSMAKNQDQQRAGFLPLFAPELFGNLVKSRDHF